MPHGSWVRSKELFEISSQGLLLSPEDVKKLFQKCKQAMQAGQSLDVANLFSLGLSVGGQTFIERVQQKGLLRLSRFHYNWNPATHAATEALTMGEALDQKTLDYLRSVAHMHTIAKSACRANSEVIRFLEAEKESGLKTLLATVEMFSMRQTAGHWESSNDGDSTSPTFFSAIDFADAFSTILAIYVDTFGELSSNPPINQGAHSDGTYFAILIAAAHLVAYRRWELLVDRYGYTLTHEQTTNTYTLTSPSKEFLRAYELGHILTLQQKQVNVARWLDDQALSITTYCCKLKEILYKIGAIKFHEEPIPRIVIGFPLPSLIVDGFTGSPEGGHFQEEILNLMQASRDLMASEDDILAFPMEQSRTLRLQDVMKVSRALQILRFTMLEILEPLVISRPQVVLNSLLPAWTRRNLDRFFKQLLGGAKAPLAMEFFSASSSNHKDLHYRPLIECGDGQEFLIPTNIFGNSNFLRNSFKVVNDRIHADGTTDPLAPGIATAFKSFGFEAWHSVEYASSLSGEIDVLVLMDDHLFAFECKNSLLPVDEQEAMTSLDAIRKASQQLSNLRQVDSGKFRSYLGSKLGADIPVAIPLTTGIVVSNRMFVGLRLDGHPVRGAAELLSFVEVGTIEICGDKYFGWRGDRCTGLDLRKYLEEDTVHGHYWRAMEHYYSNFIFPECKVRVPHFRLNAMKLVESLGLTVAQEYLDAQMQVPDVSLDEDKGEDSFEKLLGTHKRVNRLKSARLRKQKKIGRNAPCPCGSGKKFKKCCRC